VIGIDLSDMAEIGSIVQSDDDIARKAKLLYSMIRQYQNSFTAIEKVKQVGISIILA